MKEYKLPPQTIDASLMKTFIRSPDSFRRVILTENQLDMLRICGYYIDEDGFVTANKIAFHFEISIQSASSRLNKLWHKGYLKRLESIAESGGIEYRYIISLSDIEI